MRWRFRSSGLFSRLLMLCLAAALLVLLVAIAGIHIYRTERDTNRFSAELASLARSIGPIIEVELDNDRPDTAAAVLRAFAGMHYVVCADYMRGGERMASWPTYGCDVIKGQADWITLPLMDSASGGASINVRLKSEALGATILAETASLAVPLIAVVLVIFIVLTVAFRWLVLMPLDLLKQAMVESIPRGPVRAGVVRDDEIGSLVKVYNKLVAGSRLYIRRLDQSQSQLAASERRFRELAKVSGDWFFEMDAELNLTFISDRFYEITGLEPADVIGKSRLDLAVENTNAPNWRRHLNDLSAEREFKRFGYQLRAKAGHLVDISLSAVPLHDDNGVFVGYRGVGTDVSEIREKERQLAEANRNFGDSVTYASSIQRGLLIGSEALSAHLGTARAIWQPKDVVGGDFYWAKTIANVQYLVFFDCTGHGVPGAFMTLIVTSVLDQIAVSAPSALPAKQVLQQIHDGVCRSLHITRDEPGIDGLDCAVVRLDRSEDSLEFAGASIDLYVIDQKGTTTRHRGARMTLGYELHDQPLGIESVSMRVGSNSFVMTTDGLLTQVGEATGRVLGTRRFEAALGEVGCSTPSKLIRAIARLLKNWQGREERRDDISFIAFKPNEF